MDRGEKTKILVVEDEELIRESITARLQGLGYPTRQAESGETALDILKEDSPDLILLDLGLPGISGIQFLEILHRTDPNFPVIIVSATESVREAAAAARLGVWDFIIKPITDAFILDQTISRASEKIALIRENTRYREQLERLVKERTAELEATNAHLKESLEEREVLLREIHHRVKNNLQVLTSFISLQISKLGNRSAEYELKSILNRVKTITVVLNLRYQADRIEKVCITKIVEGICANLGSSYPPFRGFRLKKEIEEYCLHIDIAIPLGLVLNELITNSIIHAHPEGKAGGIHIMGRLTEKGIYELLLEDDGAECDKGKNLESEHGIGLMIVNGLVKQMGGSMELSCGEEGARALLFIPVEDSGS